jgi:hypothetical protein
LQSAIHANPHFGTMPGDLAEIVGFDLAGNLFANQAKTPA